MEVIVAVCIFFAFAGMIWYLSRKSQGKSDGDFFHSIRKAAECGDTIAQFKLGGMYSEGSAIERNDAEAAKWYLKAAEQDHIEAQFILGVMYERGDGVARDDDQSYKWIEKAARQGYARARVMLESDKWVLYQQARKPAAEIHGQSAGSAPEVSREQIDKYVLKAGDGDVDAQYNLGIIYYHGEGIPKDFAQALTWFQKAAEQDDADAQYNLGFMYGRGEGVEKSHGKSLEWFSKAAALGHAGAQEILAKMQKKAES